MLIKRLCFAIGLLVLGIFSIHAETIVVGQVGPMSGLDARLGRSYAQGMQLCFDAVNRTGGVNGNSFVLQSKDDRGRPEDTVAMTRTLISENKPLVLAGYFGNRNIDELGRSGVLEKNKLVMVGYRVSDVRAEASMMYSVRASMADELQKITQHLSTIGINRLGLLYEEGASAGAVLAAATDAAKLAGASVLVKASYAEGSTKVASAVDQIAAAAPQAVIMISTGAATTAAFIEQYRAAGGAGQLFALSGADIEQLSQRLSEEQMQGVVIAQVTPNPYAMTSRLSKELVDTIARTTDKPTVSPSYALMEGFIACKVIVEAVRRQGKVVAREGMKPALDSISAYDLGGYQVGFSPTSHTGSRFVALSIISAAGRIRQ